MINIFHICDDTIDISDDNNDYKVNTIIIGEDDFDNEMNMIILVIVVVIVMI